MPTFTTVALETLLEPRFRDSYKHNLKQQQQQQQQQSCNPNPNPNPRPPTTNHHIYISPALYTTPEPTPVTPDSSSDSHSPSPYVFNRKGRGGKVAGHRVDGVEVRSGEDESGSKDGFEGELEVEEEVVEDDDDDVLGMEVVEEEKEDSVADDGFFELRCESSSVGSSTGMNDLGKGVEKVSCGSNQGEFFDADDGEISCSVLKSSLICVVCRLVAPVVDN